MESVTVCVCVCASKMRLAQHCLAISATAEYLRTSTVVISQQLPICRWSQTSAISNAKNLGNWGIRQNLGYWEGQIFRYASLMDKCMQVHHVYYIYLINRRPDMSTPCTEALNIVTFADYCIFRGSVCIRGRYPYDLLIWFNTMHRSSCGNLTRLGIT